LKSKNDSSPAVVEKTSLFAFLLEDKSDSHLKTLEGPFTLATYELPSGHQLLLRERPEKKRLTLQELFSHQHHGVDNTGNIKVWFSEQVLLHCLLQPSFWSRFDLGQTYSETSSLDAGSILELGGGMTAMTGIGIATGFEGKFSNIVVTDGNPEAVVNMKVCVELNASVGNIARNVVQPIQLLWDRLDVSGSLSALKQKFVCGFDLIIAADCLFFQDFHRDLCHVLCTVLSETGKVLLLQPARGDSLDNFLTICKETFDASVFEEYDEEVSRLHCQYMEENCGRYDPNIHYPVLVVLKRL